MEQEKNGTPQYFKAGGELRLQCVLMDPEDNRSIQWQQDGFNVENADSFYVTREESIFEGKNKHVGTLIKDVVTVDDQGTYTCTDALSSFNIEVVIFVGMYISVI